MLIMSFNKNIDFIIFDLDDTLISEEEWYLDKWKLCGEYLENNFQVKGFYDIMKKILIRNGFDYSRKIQDVLTQLDRSDLDVSEIVDFYLNAKVIPKVFPETHKVLSSLQKSCLRGLITDGKKWEQKIKVTVAGLQEYFDVIEYSEKKPKPNPEPYINCLRRNNKTPNNSIFVGNDPDTDFVGARKLGIITVRIIQGLKKNVVPKKGYEANFSFRNLNQFYNEFKKNHL